MSREIIIGIGSETKPPILVTGECQQWKWRIVCFFDRIDKNLMKSIREGPLKVYVTIATVVETNDSPAMPSYQIEKPYDKLTPIQKERIKVDERALSLLTMALPNDMYARVDNLGTTKESAFKSQTMK